jgi:hypothetical protein
MAIETASALYSVLRGHASLPVLGHLVTTGHVPEIGTVGDWEGNSPRLSICHLGAH